MLFDPSTDKPLDDHIWMDDQDNEPIPPNRLILGANIQRLMKARPKLATNTRLFVKTGIAVATISRLINGKTAATLDTLAKLADAFGVQPWQLLIPDLDAHNPQILRNSSPEEAELYKRLREVIAKEAAVQAQGSDSGFQPLPGAGNYKKITPIPRPDEDDEQKKGT